MTGERAGSNWMFGNAKNGVLNQNNLNIHPKNILREIFEGAEKKMPYPKPRVLEKWRVSIFITFSGETLGEG